MNYAYLIEHDLRIGKYLAPKGNPWLAYSDLLSGKIQIPGVAYNSELGYYKAYWHATADKQKQVLMLLSRFELDSSQISYWVEKTECYDDLLANPYLISEEGDTSISTQMVDYGVIPDVQIQGDWIPKAPSCVETLIDKRRIRSLTIEKLRFQADLGDTLLSMRELDSFLKEELDKDKMLLPPDYLLKVGSFKARKYVFFISD